MDPGEDKPFLTLSNDFSNELSGSESDNAPQQLEVVFNGDSSHRRKSSFRAGILPQPPKRPAAGARQKTNCFVHGLLQDDRLHNNKQQQQQQPSPPQTVHEEDHADGTGEPLQREQTQSRLLSKKELSDMAFGIRELSKKLNNFKLKLKVKNIFLLTKAHDTDLIEKTRDVADWLLSDASSGGPYTVYVEQTLEHNSRFNAKRITSACDPPKGKLKFWTNELCRTRPDAFDIVLALGGDGTVLYASWLFQRIVPPVLAFALGSLGFLTKFDFASYRDTLTDAFERGLTVSLRLRLEATVMRAQDRKAKDEGEDGEGGKTTRDLIEELVGEEFEGQTTHRPETTHDILNDLVLDRGPNPTMSSIEVFGDNFHITSVQADGVCVATPTGSTAYNLAAGGSLCHPDNPVVLLTAICAHTLSFRPIILPDTIVLRLGVPYDARTNPWVSFDGKERVELRAGDYVTISASRFPFPTVLPLGRGSEDWIDGLSRTLNWNSRQRQKALKD